VLQPTSTPSSQPLSTAIVANAAPATAIPMATKPPLCEFDTIITDSLIVTVSIADYTVSPPTVVFTDAREINVYGWLPDSERLIIGRWDPNRKAATLDTLKISPRLIQTYAERASAGGDRPIWLPDLQAMVYTDFDLPQKPSSLPGIDLWLSRGNPNETQLLVEHVSMNSLNVDGTGQLVYLFSQKNTEAVDLSVKTVNAASFAVRDVPLPAALSKASASTDESMPEVEKPWELLHRPTTSQTLLLYKNQPPVIFDFNSGQICQIELTSYVSEALWSPDGRFLAMRTQNAPASFTVPDALIILDTSTNQHYEVDLGPSVYGMTWSPNSRHLAALVQKRDALPQHQVHQDLFLVDAVSREVRHLFPDYDFRGGAIQHYQMAWSPNGETLAVTCPIWPSSSTVIAEFQLCLLQLNLPK
jgi:WD40 repeat protein